MTPNRNAQMYDAVEDAYRVDPAAFRDEPAASASPPRPAGDGSPDGVGAGFAGMLGDVTRHLKEAADYGGYYLSAKVDGIKVSARNLALYAVLGVVAGIVGLAALATAAVLLLSGLAGMLGTLFGGRYNLSAFLVGLLVLAGVGVGAVLFMNKLTAASRRRTVEKYESRKHQQRAQYGHDVGERSATATAAARAAGTPVGPA